MSQVTEVVLNEISRILRPLRVVVESDDPQVAFARFLRSAGWRVTVPANVAAVLDTIAVLTSTLDRLRADPVPDSLAEAVELLDQVATLTDSLRSVGSALAEGSAAVPISPADAAALADDVAQALILDRLRREPVLYAALEVLGFVDTVAVTSMNIGGWLERRAGNRARLVPEALPAFLGGPVEHLLGRLVLDGWQAQTDAVATNILLYRLLQPMLARIGGVYRLHPNILRDPGNLGTLGREATIALKLRAASGAAAEVGVFLKLLSARDTTPGGASGPAVTITPFGSFEAPLDVSGWDIDVCASARIEGEDGKPAPAFTLGLHGVEADPGLAARLQITAGKTLDLTVGGLSTGLYLGELKIMAFGALTSGVPDFGFSLTAEQSRVGIATADLGDAVHAIVPFEASLDFDLGLSWSHKSGLGLTGQAGLDVPIGNDIHLGQIASIKNLRLSVEVTDSIAAEVVGDLNLTLGPVSLVMDDLGLASVLSFPVDGGNLGGADLAIALRRPTAVGIALDAGIARGGGFLFLDWDKGEYAGVLDVGLLGVDVTAIGIIATKLPGGWSMFLSLSATFTGRPIGFGFTLNGVGGLVGVNRGLDPEALGEGIRTGTLDSILFPDDPVANAPQILSDLGAVFPAQQGQYVIGPIAKLGWGVPTLMEADLGVVAELPDPVTFTLLGSLWAVLPDEKLALLVFNVDVAGTFDVTNGTLAIDASLRDSQVVGLALSGDMALRASFLGTPGFLMSFGGFNPHFSPPATFPELRRLSVALDTGDNLRIGLCGYFALTSNTVQFGAGADVWAKAAGLIVEGHFNFDALIQFSPFHFILDIGFSVDVRAGRVNLFGVHLALMFSGPNPFHVVGTATMKILGIRTSFDLDEVIGRKTIEPPRDTVYARALLVEALEDPASWREAPPDAGALPLVLADPVGDGTGPIRVHPAGSLDVKQRIVPLKRRVEKFGTARLGDLSEFRLLTPRVGDAAAVTPSDLTEWFAPAQYFEMSDEEKLSSPSFEEMPGGLRLAIDGVAAGVAQGFVLDYEQIIKDDDIEHIAQPGTRHTDTGRSLHIDAQRRAGARKARAPQFSLAPTTWVALNDETGEIDQTLTPMGADGTGASWSEARMAATSRSGARAVSLSPRHEVAA